MHCARPLPLSKVGCVRAQNAVMWCGAEDEVVDRDGDMVRRRTARSAPPTPPALPNPRFFILAKKYPGPVLPTCDSVKLQAPDSRPVSKETRCSRRRVAELSHSAHPSRSEVLAVLIADSLGQKRTRPSSRSSLWWIKPCFFELLCKHFTTSETPLVYREWTCRALYCFCRLLGFENCRARSILDLMPF